MAATLTLKEKIVELEQVLVATQEALLEVVKRQQILLDMITKDRQEIHDWCTTTNEDIYMTHLETVDQVLRTIKEAQGGGEDWKTGCL
jgi:hypothetical protein